MARGLNTFRQRDVTRALRSARATGMDVARVEIDRTGKIVMVMGKPVDATLNPERPANTWDQP